MRKGGDPAPSAPEATPLGFEYPALEATPLAFDPPARASSPGKEKAAEVFAQTLAENRKYGEGVIIVEQVPTKPRGLITDLRGRVREFPALPETEPGLSQAAYCPFLHALAVRTMRFSAAWPRMVAARLGLATPADESGARP